MEENTNKDMDMENLLDNNIDEISKEANDYLNEIVEESKEQVDEEPEFEKNKEGVTGDEWKEDEIKRTKEEIEKEHNRKNAERRLRNKKNKHEDESEEDESEDKEDNFIKDDQLDAESARVYRQRLEVAESFINDNAEMLQTINELGMNKQQLEMGAQFVKRWSSDPVGTTKQMLTFLENRGIDISQIYDHQVDDKQYIIDREVNRRIQPMLEEQRQRQAMEQARQTLDNFLGQYPDAETHLGEIVEVMKRANLRDPYDAYDRLRRVYRNRGVDWFGREPEEEVPQLNSRQRAEIPVEPEPKTLRDLIRTNTRKYFNGDL